MPIDPVKIPQNVYVEDRIIGPITLKQLMIVMVSAGISYAIWAAMKSAGPVSSLQTGLAWTPTVIGIVFAFVKINGISLFRIILLTLERLDKPSRRLWVPRTGIYVNIVTRTKESKPSKSPQKATKEEGRIKELSEVLDQGPPEEPEEEHPVSPQEASTQPPRPVNPKRVQADTRDTPVDDIAHPDTDEPQSSGGLLRDISPPPSHA